MARQEELIRSQLNGLRGGSQVEPTDLPYAAGKAHELPSEIGSNDERAVAISGEKVKALSGFVWSCHSMDPYGRWQASLEAFFKHDVDGDILDGGKVGGDRLKHGTPFPKKGWGKVSSQGAAARYMLVEKNSHGRGADDYTSLKR